MRNVIKVLIVDDDKASGSALAEVVKRLGFKPILTHKPSDALNIVRLQTVHAALVDVLLPKISGVDLAMEFRQTKFDENPIVFVSGVFKDKAFASDAMKKTGAVDFLFKPFGPDELTESLKKALSKVLISEKWSVQSLLTRRFTQPRDRAKAIEHLEQVKGLDFPFVLTFLLDGGISGHLNIVNNAGEIFGVTLSHGCISDVDSAESNSTAVLALISKGYLTQEDWDQYQETGNKRFSLERLVQEGLVSPHAVAVAKREQIIEDFKSIYSSEGLQLNFVPQEDAEEMPKHAVRIDDLLSPMILTMGDLFSLEYLKDFYASVVRSPIHLIRDQNKRMLEFKSLPNDLIPSFIEHVGRKETLEMFLKAHPEKTEQIYHLIHVFVLNGLIVFDDLNKAKDAMDLLERFKKLYSELGNRTPDKVFEYFGANANANSTILANIYDEYMKSNSPESLPKGSSPELLDLSRKCLEIVKNAHLVMTDPEKRAEFFEQQKKRNAENIRTSNQLVAEGLESLRRGQFASALEKVKEAGLLHSTPMQSIIRIWAEIKAGAGNDKNRLFDMSKQLDALSADDRKSAYYFMAIGLVKKHMGDSTASGYFEKALQIDPQFVEARRELNTMSVPKKEKLDLLTGDITAIVTQLFKRKAE